MLRRFHMIRTSLAVAISAQMLVLALTATIASAQQQQPQYGEGPGVVTRSLPTTGSGDVQQPIYGEGPGVMGSKLPNTGDGSLESGFNWGVLVLILGVATGLFSVVRARARKLSRTESAYRVMVVTPGVGTRS